MALCFQLFPRQDKPAKLSAVDAAMCAHFGVPVDEKFYYCGWFDTVGYLLATGRTFEEAKARIVELDIQPQQKLLDICDWIADNYTVDSFSSR